MNLGKFRFGGVHPNDHKEAAEIVSSVFPKPKTVLIASAQHAGAPAKIIKKKDDDVKKGELIAEAQGYVSASIHASISGKVASIETVPIPLGRGSQGCLIQETENVTDTEYKLNPSFMSLSAEEMLSKIANAGIVGMGGAMFPTSVKIAGSIKSNCDILLINGVECEPYITSDYRLMLEHTEEIYHAIEIIRHIVPSIKKTVIGIENNKPQAVKKMIPLSKENNVEVLALKLQYPQGAEKMLIDAATQRVVPIGKFPPDIGVLVINIATMKAIYDAVAMDKPLIERLITITGDAIKEKKNLWIPFGTTISEIVDYCGGLLSDNILAMAGGPMMGFALPALNRNTIKGNNALVFLDANKIKKEKEYPCISCERCSNVCPVRLVPTEIAHAAKAGDKELVNKYNIMSCFECGACSYICSSKIPLVQLIRIGKDLLRR